MKKLLILLIFILPVSIFSNDRVEVWSRMYRRAFTPKLKYSVMLSIVELNDRSLIPLLEEILSDDIIANLNNERTIIEDKEFIDLTKLVVKELGELKARDSAELVYQIYQNIDDPLLRADCLVAIGDMRATEFVDDIVYILETKNLTPIEGISSDTEAESKISYGAISALDRFRDIRGYSPVFFASLGWYNDRVKNYADKVLKTIVENPIEALIPILKEGDFSSKEKAIVEVDKCNASPEDKITAAREGLKQGHDNVQGSVQEGMKLTSLRKKSILILYKNKSNSPEDAYYLNQSLKNGADPEEQIYAIRTLSLNGSDEAIDLLIKALQEFNDRNLSGVGISYSEEDLVRELIVALGDSGNSKVKAVLTEVQFSNYTNTIIRKANEALKKLN